MAAAGNSLSMWMALHRWLGLIACVAVVLFAGSGLIHPIMSSTQPQPVAFAAPNLALQATPMPLAAVLRQHDLTRFSGAGAVMLPGQAAYRVQPAAPGSTLPARYFAVADGREIDGAEAAHAELLARHFSGDSTSALSDIAEITAFDAEYLPINRLLPVWRLRFARDDGLTLYIDTAGNRLATQVDNRKRWLQGLFRALHSFSFLEEQPTLRLPLMLLLLSATFTTAVAGVVMYVRLKRATQRLRRLPARRWHRRLSLLVAATAFSFTLSGGWHLLHGAGEPPLPAPLVSLFDSATLGDFVPSGPFTLAQIDARPCFRVATMAPRDGGHHRHGTRSAPTQPPAHCLDTHDGAPLRDGDRRLAERLARHFSGSDAAATMVAVTAFGGEYGFINKRLPVWRVQFEGEPARWYVEPSSGALALRADNLDAAEGWSFAYLHKWSFFGEHKNLRDALMMAFAALHLIVALLGLWLFATGRRRASASVVGTRPDPA